MISVDSVNPFLSLNNTLEVVGSVPAFAKLIEPVVRSLFVISKAKIEIVLSSVASLSEELGVLVTKPEWGELPVAMLAEELRLSVVKLREEL